MNPLYILIFFAVVLVLFWLSFLSTKLIKRKDAKVAKVIVFIITFAVLAFISYFIFAVSFFMQR